MTFRRLLVAAVSIAFSSMWGIAIYGYFVLPARFPAHFDAEGVADRFATKSFGSWFSVPILFTVLTGVFVAMAVFTPRLAARYPRFINVPEKESFVRLPEGARVSALEPMRDLALMMPIALHALGAYLEWGIIGVALGRSTTLSPYPIVLVLAYSFVALGYTVVRMRDAVLAAGKRGA